MTASRGLAGFIARARATTRLAVRQVVRTPGASFLIVALVALPIMALTGGLVFFESHQPTRTEKADSLLGAADARIEVAGAPNDTRWQPIDDTWWASSGDDVGEAPTTAPAMIPASADIVPVEQGVSALFDTPDGATLFTVIAGPVWEERFAGAFALSSGRAPQTPHEILVTPDVLTHLDVAVGDSITTRDTAATAVTVTITGTIASLDPNVGEGTIVAMADSPVIADSWGPSWYVFGWQPTLAELVDLNHAGYIAYARDLILAGATHPEATYPPDDPRGAAYLSGTAGGAFVALLVGLIAGAAMSVSARRQQRSLAMAASVGAGRGSLFAIVLAQGIVLGLVAAVGGIAIGAGAAALVLSAMDDGVPWSTRGNWGFHMPLAPILAVAALAVTVGAVAALLPAWAATRGDTLGALRGSRRPVVMRRSWPRWGMGVMLLGLACAVAAIVMLASPAATRTDLVGVLAVVLAVTGPALLVLGTALCGHGLLTLVSRCAASAGVPTRLALRDLAANPSRTVPAFLAVTTAMMVATAALGVSAVSSASAVRTYSWSAPLHSVVMSLWADDADQDAALATAQSLAADLDPRAVATTFASLDVLYAPDSEDLADPAQRVSYVGYGGDDEVCSDASCLDGWFPAGGPLTVVAADDLPVVAGVTLTPEQRAAFESGAAIVNPMQRFGVVAADGPQDVTRVFTIPAQELVAGGDSTTTGWSEDVTWRDVPLIEVGDVRSDAQLIFSPQTAAALGVQTRPAGLIAALDAPLSRAESDRLTAAADDADSEVSAWQENGPPSGIPWLVLIAAVAGAVVLGTAVITLGLARFERRPDDLTLTAVGGEARVRRRVNASQALTIVGIGSLLGAGIGLLPATAFVSFGNDSFSFADLPWAWIVCLALGLPVLLSAVAWLIRPREAGAVRRDLVQ